MSIYEQEENNRTARWFAECEKEERHRNAVTSEYKPCQYCGCPYPGDHTDDCPEGQSPAPVEARDDFPEPEDDGGWSLRDEGRSDGQGESYAERNA